MLNKSEQEIARLMKRARHIARQGNCTGWIEVIAEMKAAGEDVDLLKSSAHAAERIQIDALCVRARVVAVHRKKAKKPAPS